MNKSPLIFLFIILFLHAIILTKLIFFPYPELFVYPYLTNNGLKPYSQILDQHFPGLMFLPINLNNLAMTIPEAARIWLIGLVIVTHILLYFISKEIFKSEKKALLANFLYLLWQPFFEGWMLWIDNFLPIFLLMAFYYLYKKKYFATGLLLGVAIVFKQVIIPLSILVFVYILWEGNNFKKTINYLFGLLPPVILMLLYFLSIGVIKDFWYWTVIFNLTVFAQYGKKEIPSSAHLLRIFVVFGYSLLSLKFWNQRIVQIILIFLCGSLLSAYARFDFVHFQPSLPFAILATVYVLGKLVRFRALGVIILIAYVLISVWWQVIFYKGHLSSKVFIFDEQTLELTKRIKQYTKAGDKIFAFGATPLLYQTTQTLPAGDVFVFQFPWFLKVTEDRIINGIKMDLPEIVVVDRTIEIEGKKITDFASKTDKYLLENYVKIDMVGNAEILKRR